MAVDPGGGDTRSPEQKNRDAFRYGASGSPEQRNRDAFRPHGARAPNPYPDGNPRPAGGGGDGPWSSGGSGEAITAQQRLAARNLLGISTYNARSTQDQLNRILGTYDQADKANAALAETDFRKNANLSDADRFAQAQKLQSSARGLFSAAGNAMQGSQRGEVGTMLNRRNRQDQTKAVTTLRGNQQDVQRTKDESLNANVNARRDAMTTAAFALRGLESDYAAQLNNINPKLYTAPGTGAAQFGSKGVVDRFGQVQNVTPTTIGYYTTDAQIRGGYA